MEALIRTPWGDPGPVFSAGGHQLPPAQGGSRFWVGAGKVCFHPRVEALVTWAATPNREGLHTKLVEGPHQVVLVVRTTACPENSKNGTFQAEAPVDFSTSRTMARRPGHLRSFFLGVTIHHTYYHTSRWFCLSSGAMRLILSLQACFCDRNRKTRVCPGRENWSYPHVPHPKCEADSGQAPPYLYRIYTENKAGAKQAYMYGHAAHAHACCVTKF